MSLHAIPCKKRDDDAPICNWCHPLRTCWQQGFDNLNCPRVSAISFLDNEQIHSDGWHISGVSFGEPDMQLEILPEGDSEES